MKKTITILITLSALTTPLLSCSEESREARRLKYEQREKERAERQEIRLTENCEKLQQRVALGKDRGDEGATVVEGALTGGAIGSTMGDATTGALMGGVMASGKNQKKRRFRKKCVQRCAQKGLQTGETPHADRITVCNHAFGLN